jgi:hypothetical protein
MTPQERQIARYKRLLRVAQLNPADDNVRLELARIKRTSRTVRAYLASRTLPGFKRPWQPAEIRRKELSKLPLAERKRAMFETSIALTKGAKRNVLRTPL